MEPDTKCEVMILPNLLTFFCKLEQFEITSLKEFVLDKQVGLSFQ